MTHHKNKHRHKPTPHAPGAAKKETTSATLKMAAIFGFIGLAIGALGSQLNIIWMIGGAAVGAVGGYLIGKAIDRAAAKK